MPNISLKWILFAGISTSSTADPSTAPKTGNAWASTACAKRTNPGRSPNHSGGLWWSQNQMFGCFKSPSKLCISIQCLRWHGLCGFLRTPQVLNTGFQNPSILKKRTKFYYPCSKRAGNRGLVREIGIWNSLIWISKIATDIMSFESNLHLLICNHTHR